MVNLSHWINAFLAYHLYSLKWVVFLVFLEYREWYFIISHLCGIYLWNLWCGPPWMWEKKISFFGASRILKTKVQFGFGWNCVYVFYVFFFFFQPSFVDFSTVNSISVHCSRTHKFHFSATFSLKMGSTVLFTHLKIILL